MEQATTFSTTDVSLAGTLTLLPEDEAGRDHHLYVRFLPQLLHWFRVLAHCTVRVVSATNRLGTGGIDNHYIEIRNSSGLRMRRLGL